MPELASRRGQLARHRRFTTCAADVPGRDGALAALARVVKEVLTGGMHLAARHPLRVALAGSLVPVADDRIEQAPSDYARQFILGWLGGLVFFGTLFA